MKKMALKLLFMMIEGSILNSVKLNTIMANIQQLSAKVDALQAALDAEQQQIKDAIAKLQQTVEDMETAGGTDADREALAEKLDDIIEDLQSTVDDGSTTTSTTETTTEA